MASLQIPFSRWDWPSAESPYSGGEENVNTSSSDKKTPHCHSTTSTNENNNISNNNHHHHVQTHHHNHRSYINSNLNCSHPKSNPIAASLSSLSAMLLEGQAVLAHQTSTAIWLFIGLNSGAIWKWTISLEAFLRNEIHELKAELVMTAHKSPIKALAMSKYRVDCTGQDDQSSEENGLDGTTTPSVYLMESLVSVDEAGELAVWNCRDGRCLLHNLRAMASGKSAGYPNSISISPNYEFCILAGFTDKLVVMRLSTLEIVQIVDVGSGSVPRWVRSAGFLLQDDPNLLLDYLTLNFNGPPGEGLTARQFDPKVGKFVSPACPILPKTIPPEQVREFATCHLLTCSRANPGLAALVTKLRKVWLIDFLSGEFVQLSLDFDIDGVEFVRADLLLVWSNTGKVAFYNVFIQPPQLSSVSPSNSQSSTPPPPLQSSYSDVVRSRSPIMGHVVRKLDFKCSFPFGNNRLHLRLLESNSPNDCASLLCIETIHCPQRRTQVSLISVEFDCECPDRTVHLYRQNDTALPLILSDTCETNRNNANVNDKNHHHHHHHHHSHSPTSLLVKRHPSPVTCTITFEPGWLIHGHVDGRISRKSLLEFFTSPGPSIDDFLITPPLEDVQSSFISAPITAMAAFPSLLLIVAGDSQGQMQFWRIEESNTFSFLGASRCHVKKIVGITESAGTVYSWASDGVVAMYQRDTKLFRCIHLFYPPTSNLGLAGLYWQRNSDQLLLDYRTVNSSTTIIHSHWDLVKGCKLPDLTDSDYLETLSTSTLKIQIEGLCEGLAAAGGRSIQPYRSSENSQLFSGVITVLGDGRQWPELPCHTLMIDIRMLVRKLQEKNNQHPLLLAQLSKLVLSQFMAWGVSERMDVICKESLKLAPNSSLIHTGLLGANGNVSLILNPQSKDRFWTLSPTLTASLQLSIVLLLASIPWADFELDETCDIKQCIANLVSFYSAKIGDMPPDCALAEEVFRPAALSFISKFWQDPDPEVQKSARILFSSTLARLSPNQQTSLISYWKDYLPNSSNTGGGSSDGRSMYRSAIILGIIGVQEPHSLSRSIKKHVAESLVALLLDGKRNIFRLSAVELIGRGYLIWLPFIHGASIFKLLYSWLIQLYGGDEQFYQTTLKAILYILTANESSAASQSTNLNDSLSTLSITSTTVSSISKRSSSSLLFAQSSPFLTWLTDLMASLNGAREVSSIERKCSLDLIRNLLDFKPVIFQGSEGQLVEIVMKLTTGGSNSTENTGNNSIFQEIESHFGVISVHQPSNRIAVCLAENNNSIAVFDLKTTNRISLLQGHQHPCTLVAFNKERPDGKQLLSYSAEEACVRWWNTSSSSSSGATSSISGLFSSFSGVHSDPVESSRPGAKPVKTVIVQPELTEAIGCIPDGSVFKLNPINITWRPQNKTVEFRVGASLVQTLPIPN